MIQFPSVLLGFILGILALRLYTYVTRNENKVFIKENEVLSIDKAKEEVLPVEEPKNLEQEKLILIKEIIEINDLSLLKEIKEK